MGRIIHKAWHTDALCQGHTAALIIEIMMNSSGHSAAGLANIFTVAARTHLHFICNIQLTITNNLKMNSEDCES